MINGKPYVIGISGKMGSGKNYLSTKLQEELIGRGYTCAEDSFAAPLKSEFTEILNTLREFSTNIDEAVQHCSQQYDIPEDEIRTLAQLITVEIESEKSFTGWDKTEGIRQGLQYLGTDIRRAKNNSYWIESTAERLPENTDIVFIPDTRFPNEADWAKEVNGIVIRLEVSREVILSRASDRDKIRYSSVAEAHPSETALDDYTKFDLIVGETFDASELADIIEKMMRS